MTTNQKLKMSNGNYFEVMHFKLKSKYEEFPPLIGKSVWYSATAAGAEVEHQMTSEIDKLLPFSIYSIHPVRTDTAIFLGWPFDFLGCTPLWRLLIYTP